jgi:hypothetical protein
MKITKTRIKEIIKEELGSLRETTQDAQVRLQRLADQLGADENFVATVRESIAAAASTHANAEIQALGLMIKALEMLSPMQEGSKPLPKTRVTRGKRVGHITNRPRQPLELLDIKWTDGEIERNVKPDTVDRS